GSGRDCDPRGDGTIPSPGITGDRHEPSEGVAEKAFLQRSTTQTYDVSGARSGSGPVEGRLENGVSQGSLGGGIPGAACMGSISLTRAATWLGDSSFSICVSTKRGSPK